MRAMYPELIPLFPQLGCLPYALTQVYGAAFALYSSSQAGCTAQLYRHDLSFSWGWG